MSKTPKTVLVIHGGIAVDRHEMTPELDAEVREGLLHALRAGHAKLRDATAMDAVIAAVMVLEDTPVFNAGRGAVFTHDGKNELDASLMNGKDKAAGAVAGLTTIKNPILAARAVMEQSPHVFLAGKGAEQFAREVGLETVDPSYFRTERRWQELQRRIEKEKATGKYPSEKRDPWGTVGAVALDRFGNLAAGTSTGGMTYKRYGRVGDSPIIGAGTYAENEGAAVSGTGHGEFFIRYCVAHDIVSLVKYAGYPLQKAADEVIQNKLKPAGGEGGVICLNARGEASMSFNSEGMYRGTITEDGQARPMIYAD